MARGRRTRCDKPSSPFVEYVPDVTTSTTTSTTQTPFIFIPESGVTCPVSTTVTEQEVEVLKCLCGSMFFPKGSESSLIVNSTHTFDLQHTEDVLVASEQEFNTKSSVLTSGSDVFLALLLLEFADKYLTNKITVDGAIKIIIKTEEGKVVATKYINDYTDKTILDNGVIQFSPSNIHKKVKLNNKFLRLEVKEHM